MEKWHEKAAWPTTGGKGNSKHAGKRIDPARAERKAKTQPRYR